MAITVNEFLSRVDSMAAKGRRDRMFRERNNLDTRDKQDRVKDAMEFYFRILPDITVTPTKALNEAALLFELSAEEKAALKRISAVRTKKVKA